MGKLNEVDLLTLHSTSKECRFRVFVVDDVCSKRLTAGESFSKEHRVLTLGKAAILRIFLNEEAIFRPQKS